MFVVYKTRSAGQYHIDNSIPCQDSYCVRNNDKEGYVIAAVADGLGSSKKSDIASRIASSSSVDYCFDNIKRGLNDEQVFEILKQSFFAANKKVRITAEEDENNYDDYDTTLCLALYDGKSLFFAQAGDSGCIALSSLGEYIQVTKQQRDSEMHVFPLCFGVKYWEFGKIDDISAFLLCTDGILDVICPELLKDQEININIPLAELLINNFEIEDYEVSELEAEMSEYWEKCPVTQINDDKTTVVVINTNYKPQRKEDCYYNTPNWDELIKTYAEKIQKKREMIFFDSIKPEKEGQLDDVIKDSGKKVQILKKDFFGKAKEFLGKVFFNDKSNEELSHKRDEEDKTVEIEEIDQETEECKKKSNVNIDIRI